MRSTTPLISVIMPVYNAEPFVERSIRSILNQSESNFELIVIDDGSTDDSIRAVKKIRDNRIEILELKENHGISHALNIGITTARGCLIARMDADDLAHPERLNLQKKFMQAHEDIGVLGTAFRVFGRAWPKVVRPPENHAAIKAAMVFSPAIGHPTAMLRSEIFRDCRFRYDERYNGAEDYELWTRIIQKFNFSNLIQPLLRYRIHRTQVSQQKRDKQLRLTNEIRIKYLESMGFNAINQLPDFAEIVSSGNINFLRSNFELFQRWRNELSAALPEFDAQLTLNTTRRFLECTNRDFRNTLVELKLVHPNLLSPQEIASLRIKRLIKTLLRKKA